MKTFDFCRGPGLCRADTRQYHLGDGRTIWTDQVSVQRNGVDVWLGNGEVEVKGAAGSGYRAPTLLYHYVTEHGYLPPQEFIDAVLQTLR